MSAIKYGEVRDLFDIHMAFARIRSLSDMIIGYQNSCSIDEETKQENIEFAIMMIHDFAAAVEDKTEEWQTGYKIVKESE